MRTKYYSVITAANVTTEYIVKAKNQDDAREQYYEGAVIEENILDTNREEIHTIDFIEEK
jgi:hypothetical protein